MENVTRSQGIELCKIIYEKLSVKGYFPALTGGLIYKEGNRKDIDIVIYRNREMPSFEISDIHGLLVDCGLKDLKHFGFVTKADWNGVVVDLFNPESVSSDNYGEE